jgi:hypothetical protein
MKVIEKTNVATIEPLLCSIAAATAIIGRGQSFIYDAVARGILKAVKSDGRTLLVVESLKSYVASLPPAKLKPDNRERRRYAVPSAKGTKKSKIIATTVASPSVR